ncbi:multisubunit sodium/proton antiporter MrpE subunit [Glaciihabitans tibetensis]|uniref:Multisubunit sodium/proton antiporter MrpE subunit n=1 Tax=Glaciihabitans tibetensis TaxID=1266600 RepID=A0A2T0VFN5_9MICO|nr:Na+/H+ antiporter subunit E [Glaciihabitans tibetensis]PRY69019.1 multisubunit sodium/proton antiporter MrpE subunit [Glaciihabitans tibetensis]
MTQDARVRQRLWQQLPLLVGLVVLWMLLWGSLSLLNLVTGILVALLVTRVFFLPPVELSGRFNIFWLALFLAKFFGDLVFASFQVAYQALRPSGISQSSLIAVQLVTRSDFVLTLTSIALSLVPGSLVVEVDRERSILYLHALNTRNLDDVDAVRAQALRVEYLIVRVLGSKEDVKAVTS